MLKTAVTVSFVSAVLATGCAAPVGAQSSPTPSQTQAMRSYLVVLRSDVKDVPAEARRLVAAVGGRLGHVYQSALRGFSVQTDAAGAERLRLDPSVGSVEEDAPVRIAPGPQ